MRSSFNYDVLKEPRGFIKCIEIVSAIKIAETICIELAKIKSGALFLLIASFRNTNSFHGFSLDQRILSVSRIIICKNISSIEGFSTRLS